LRSPVKYALIVPALLSNCLHAQSAAPVINQWSVTADMATPRAGACSVRLVDGRVLIAGGTAESGALSTVEYYGPDGFSVAAPLLEPRTHPACAALKDGRVLVTGGSRDDQPLRSAEVYDPSTGSWSSAGNMSVARSGHTAAVTPWGSVILIGGEESGTVEAFLATGSFISIGRLSTPRTAYSLTVLQDRRILIAGGFKGTTAVSTVEIYNADDNTILPAPELLSPRANGGAAALYDGTVLVSGGYGPDSKPLSTTEIYDPRTGISLAGPSLRQPRAGHTSYILPNNGQVLIVGGTDGENSLAATEIFAPWTAGIDRTGGMHSRRSAMSLSLSQPGRILAAGGRNGNGYLAGSEVYSFATVESDRSDYRSGETTTLMGRGWRPGETVSLNVTAFPLDEHRTESTGTAQADENGQVLFKGFSIDPSHAGARFLASARGSESQAQTVFASAELAAVAPPFTITTNPINPTALSNFTVTITLSPVGGIVPTGQVQLVINSANSGNLTPLVNGSATLPVPPVSLQPGRLASDRFHLLAQPR